MNQYHPKNYWEERLSERFTCVGVGQIDYSERYNKWIYKARIRALKKALAQNSIRIRGQSVCDVGCGTGLFIDFYHGLTPESLTGIDITQISIDKLKQTYPQYDFRMEDITSPLLTERINRKFDILSVFDVLYHITDDTAFGGALENICSLTQENGHLIITDSCGAESVDIAQHVRRRSRTCYETIFKKHDVEITGMYPLYNLLTRPVLGVVKQSKGRKLGKRLDDLLGPFYYLIDGIWLPVHKSPINLIVAHKRKR